LNPLIITILALSCGVTIPRPAIPAHYDWMYKLDPFTRVINGMLSTELHSRPVVCRPSEFNKFALPPGQNCEYALSFLEAAPGYVKNLTATETCEYCPFTVGDEFLTSLGMAYDRRWLDIGVLAAFVGGNLVVFFLAVGLPFFSDLVA
jgi:ABC-type multidrug transport system permease subunit